jgi:OMF family outer membrane factor
MLNAIKLNIGVALEKEIEIDDHISFQPSLAYARKTNLDLQIIQTQKKMLNTEMNTLTKSRYLPSFNLIASYGTTGFGYDKKPNNFLKFYPVGFAGLQLTYPLFNGTITQRKISQKKLEISNNELQSKLIYDKNNMDIENISRQRTVAEQTITNTDHQILLAQSIYDQTILQQKQGTASLTDVLLADNSLREAQQNYLTAVIDYLKADLELKKLTGNILNQSSQP